MEDNSSTFSSVLTLALAHALDHLSPDDHRPVNAPASLTTLRQRLDLPLNEACVAPKTVLNDLVSGVEGGIIDSAGGRFYGWVIGGSLPAALAADWLTSAWDQNAGLFACSPAAAVVEETAGRWLKELLHLPATASFAFVTGAQMAHTTCLAAARHALLARNNWDVELNGLSGSPTIRILTSTEKHGTVNRAVRLLGLGEKNITTLPADPNGRLSEESLKQALEAESTAPTIVILQAGDLNLGAFDDFATLIPLAKKYNAWVHIDGAFGLWTSACPRLTRLTHGVELADSWATDGHKWLNVPYDCGYAFVRDAQAHRAAFAHHAAYVPQGVQTRDAFDWTPEFSRRARGFATYAAIRELGRSGVAGLIDRCCTHAHSLATQIGVLPGAELVWEPQINQGLVRFLSPDPAATAADHDSFTDRVTAAILADGEALFSNTTWRGKRCMRISVCNWQTSDEDVTRTVASVARVLAAAQAAD